MSAVSGVYNEALLKGVNASLHAQNMALYAAGFVINIGLYIITKILKRDEPGIFQGFDSLGAFLVILSNVFIGLATTAVYKCKPQDSKSDAPLMNPSDADALIKCFSTAISTAILLYLSPIFFGASTSFLVLPGTVIIFIASWLYLRGGAESGQNAHDQTAKPESDGITTGRQKLGNWARVREFHVPSSTRTFVILSAYTYRSESPTSFAWSWSALYYCDYQFERTARAFSP